MSHPRTFYNAFFIFQIMKKGPLCKFDVRLKKSKINFLSLNFKVLKNNKNNVQLHFLIHTIFLRVLIYFKCNEPYKNINFFSRKDYYILLFWNWKLFHFLKVKVSERQLHFDIVSGTYRGQMGGWKIPPYPDFKFSKAFFMD